MTDVMTPSVTMTDRQIDKAADVFRAALRRHRAEFGSEAVQQVLGCPDFGPDLLAVFRRRVEMMSNLIIRKVKVNRDRTPQTALDATGRVQYTNRKVVDAMPRGEGEEVEVFFFRLGRFVSDAELDSEYALRGLVPADPISVAAVNEADPAFADEKPHGTHWKDAEDNWCYATFDRWVDERLVDVDRSGRDWDDYWWFAGCRK